MKCDELLSLLHNVKKQGQGWIASCPAHYDRVPSLSILRAQDGQPLIHCFAGCSYEAVLEAMNLLPHNIRSMENYAPATVKRQIEEIYDYQDESGELSYQVVRYCPKDFRCRRADDQGGWIWNMKDTRRLLYKLPEVLNAKLEGNSVFLLEGEKDVRALADLGFCATCNPGGAVSLDSNGQLSKWDRSFTETLRGAHIVLIPDNDDAGTKHVRHLSAELRPVVSSLKIVELPNRDHQKVKDVYDWIRAGGTRAEMDNILSNASEFDDGGFGDARSAQSASDDESWEPIVPFDTPSDNAEFPVDVLPSPFREYAIEIAESRQVPLGLPGALALGAVSMAGARRFEVSIGVTHTEPINLFLLVLLEPGTRKSASFRDILFPVEDHEAEIVQQSQPDIVLAKQARARQEERLKYLKSQYARASSPDKREDFSKQADELMKSLIEVPNSPRLLVGDCTPETLAGLMEQNHGRICQADAEGGSFFDIISGRYSSSGSPNVDHYLRAHAGDSIRVDRVGRASEQISKPALTVCCTAQPSLLKKMNSKDILRGRGFLARFLFSLPASLVGERLYGNRQIDPHTRDKYKDVLTAMLKHRNAETCQPVSLIVGAEALERWAAGHDSVEMSLGPDGRLSHIRDWGAKLPGAVARIAGVLHLMRHGSCTEIPDNIEMVTMDDAWKIGDYFTEHALAAFEIIGGNNDHELARRILSWIRRHRLTHFKQSELYMHLRNGEGVTSADDLDLGLEVLENRNYIRKVVEEESGKRRGRKPSPLFQVNPVLFEAAPINGD